MAFQETKINSSIATSELFPESCPYITMYNRKDRNLHGSMENNSDSVLVKVFANKTSHCVASWYRQPGGTSEDFQLFRDQLDNIRNQHKGKNTLWFMFLGISTLEILIGQTDLKNQVKR